jgi:tetratricopeptide (TPR) repeat protein
MSHQERASRLGKEAFDLWEKGRLEEALPRYKSAIEIADPAHWATPGLHVECAAILALLGLDQEASSHYEHAIAILIAQGTGEDDPELVVTACFFAEHLLRMNNPDGALAVIARARSLSRGMDHLLSSVESQALWALGRHDEAKRVAQRAVAGAPTPDSANRISTLLSEMLESRDG